MSAAASAGPDAGCTASGARALQLLVTGRKGSARAGHDEDLRTVPSKAFSKKTLLFDYWKDRVSLPPSCKVRACATLFTLGFDSGCVQKHCPGTGGDRGAHEGKFQAKLWRVVYNDERNAVAEIVEYERNGMMCGACIKSVGSVAAAAAVAAAMTASTRVATAGAAGAGAITAASAGAAGVCAAAGSMQGAVGRAPADAAEIAAVIAPALQHAVVQAVTGVAAPLRRFAAGVAVSSVRDELRTEGLYVFTQHFAMAMEHVVRVLKIRKGLVQYTGNQSALEVVQRDVRLLCYQQRACASHS
jgi:hypothetical protein